ncbi:MAG: transglycosylase domain-containing protein [Patescibacteria group bacterium]
MVDYARRGSRRTRIRNGNSSKIFLYSKLSKYALIGLIGFVILTIVLFLWYGRDLPTPGKLSDAQLSNSTRIYDRNGKLLYSVFQEENRTYVKLSDIPENLRNATIAIEDKDFYKNQGFSVWGYVRVLRDVVLLRGLTGGSTITQQLVKTVLLSSERTLPRKIKELMLSIQVSQKYSKDQILEMYLNDVPYGGANIGVEAASQSYFGKDVKDLNIAESAFLAGLPQAPSIYSPYSGNKYYVGRTEAVLKQMTEEKYITKDQSEQALKEIENKKFTQRDESIKAPHFVIYVKQLLAKQFGESAVDQGGLQVTTTLDYDIEKEAEKIVKEEIDKLKGYKVGNGAAVVMDPKTGEILSMVGSRDYFDTDKEGNFNTALARRQPGSSLKPIIYATAFEKGYTPSTLLMDLKTDFPTDDPKLPIYTPVNYDGKYRGPMQVRFALGNSLNVPAVKMLAKVGIKDVMQKGYSMGINNWQPTAENLRSVGLSLVLGGRETTLLDEVTAYSVFANKGVKHDPVAILKVTDSKGHKLFEHKKKDGEKVLSEGVAFLISHILLDNNARSIIFGPSSWLNVSGKTVSVKTGTTDQKRDNWTVGYTPSIAVGVWVGNNDNTAMNAAIASGVTGASPIWNRIMRLALKDKKDEQPQKPDSVVALQIDGLGGGLPFGGQPGRSEYFVKGTEPTGPGPIYQKVKLSRHDNGKLASPWEIENREYDTKDYIVFQESDPVSTDGKNRWQDAINAWLSGQFAGDDKYHPPTETSNYSGSDSKKEDKKEENNPTSTPTPSPTLIPTPIISIP